MSRRAGLRWMVVFLGGAMCGAIWFGSGSGARQPLGSALAQDKPPQPPPTLASLAQDVATLKAKVTDQSHVMSDVDYHFSNLWFAAKADNWPLADFYWKETVSHIRWAVRVIPVRKDSAGREVKLEDILKGIEQSPFLQMGKTIEQKDHEKFEATYRLMLDACYTCHKASEKPYLRPQIPQRPASSIINFDPHATWPK